MILGWALRLLLFLMIIRLAWRFLAGVIDGLTPPAARGSGAAKNTNKSVPLVRDPVCGTYVVRERALTLDTRHETQYFCSERCRDEYARRGYALREAK
jgi:YHS domain-containing protein